jgi:hypothetical protein
MKCIWRPPAKQLQPPNTINSQRMRRLPYTTFDNIKLEPLLTPIVLISRKSDVYAALCFLKTEQSGTLCLRLAV